MKRGVLELTLVELQYLLTISEKYPQLHQRLQSTQQQDKPYKIETNQEEIELILDALPLPAREDRFSSLREKLNLLIH